MRPIQIFVRSYRCLFREWPSLADGFVSWAALLTLVESIPSELTTSCKREIPSRVRLRNAILLATGAAPREFYHSDSVLLSVDTLRVINDIRHNVVVRRVRNSDSPKCKMARAKYRAAVVKVA